MLSLHPDAPCFPIQAALPHHFSMNFLNFSKATVSSGKIMLSPCAFSLSRFLSHTEYTSPQNERRMQLRMHDATLTPPDLAACVVTGHRVPHVRSSVGMYALGMVQATLFVAAAEKSAHPDRSRPGTAPESEAACASRCSPHGQTIRLLQSSLRWSVRCGEPFHSP
jgi:hypothetical protein